MEKTGVSKHDMDTMLDFVDTGGDFNKVVQLLKGSQRCKINC